jgi:FolB domain-containing protein
MNNHLAPQHNDIDQVLIDELELQVRIGCSPEERSATQKVLLDIQVGIGRWRPPAQEGSLEGTVDYYTLASAIESWAKKKEWVLLEDLAEGIALNTLEYANSVQSVDIQARKFTVPNAKSAGVRLYRTR